MSKYNNSSSKKKLYLVDHINNIWYAHHQNTKTLIRAIVLFLEQEIHLALLNRRKWMHYFLSLIFDWSSSQHWTSSKLFTVDIEIFSVRLLKFIFSTLIDHLVCGIALKWIFELLSQNLEVSHGWMVVSNCFLLVLSFITVVICQ